MTNNPEKVAALQSAGIEVTERVSAEVEPQDTFERYLRTKQEKMGHILVCTCRRGVVPAGIIYLNGRTS